MFCSKCGSQLADGSAFCSTCGAAVAPQPAEETVTQSSVQPEKSAPPMGWFKFLINFSLWAGAILNLISAIAMLTGNQYGSETEISLVYGLFPKLQTLDILCGMLLIILAVFAIYTRFQLARFKKKAPLFLTILYIGCIVYGLFYIIGCYSILPAYVLSNMNFTSMYGSLISSLVWIFINNAYFKKRAHLFIND